MKNFKFTLALRSLIFRKKQFTSLFLVCVFGIGISIACLSVTRGMMFSLSQKARIYFGGDYMFSGGIANLSLDNVSETVEKVKNLLPENTIVTPRYNFEANNSAFYFEGNEIIQRVINGVDFDNEKQLFEDMNFVEGSWKSTEEMRNDKGILISTPMARKLGAKVGDKITFLSKLSSGFIDTADVEVKGIFQDSSVFGTYTSYVDIDFLRDFAQVNPKWANRICIQLKNKNFDIEKTSLDFQKRLEKEFNMFHLVEDKKEFYDLLSTFSEPTFAIIPLSANLNETRVMEIAMLSVTLFVISMLVLIIVVGIGSSFKVIVMKRINEIGIYMSLGMKKSGIILTLTLETLILLIAGCIAGTIFSFVICWALKTFDFSFIPSFDIFLSSGNLQSEFDLKGSLIVFLSVIVVTLLFVIHSVKKIVSIMPVKALATTE